MIVQAEAVYAEIANKDGSSNYFIRRFPTVESFSAAVIAPATR